MKTHMHLPLTLLSILLATSLQLQSALLRQGFEGQAAMEKTNTEQQHDAAIALALEWGIPIDDHTLNQTDNALTLAQRLALDKSNVEKARKQLQQHINHSKNNPKARKLFSVSNQLPL